MRYRVTYKRLYTCTVDIEAKSEDEAEEIAISEWLPRPAPATSYSPLETWVASVIPVEDIESYENFELTEVKPEENKNATDK